MMISSGTNKFNIITIFSPLFISAILFSGFSNKIFDIGGAYFFEGAVMAVVVYSMAIKNDFFDCLVRAARRNASFLFFSFLALTPLFFIGGIIGESFANAYTDFRALCCLPLGMVFMREAWESDRLDIVAWMADK